MKPTCDACRVGVLMVVAGPLIFWPASSFAQSRLTPTGPPSAAAPEPAHFHHVHLNIADPRETVEFYKKYFGANEVKYQGLSDGLFTEKSFILLHRVDTAPPSNLGTSLWHIGWAGVDGPHEFKWRTEQGIGVQTPVTPLGSNHYMYFWGPSREVIEVYTGSKNHRFEHMHLLATDVDATIRWFVDHLGLTPRWQSARPYSGVSSNIIRVDNVNLIVFSMPGPGEPRPEWYPKEMQDDFVPTQGTAIDHIAFSYPDVEPVYQRMNDAGLEIVRSIAQDPEYGITSFFVLAPDKLLIEIIQEKHIPEGIWQ